MASSRRRTTRRKRSTKKGVRKAKNRGCTPRKGKKSCKVVNGRKVSYGAKGYKIKPGSKKGDSYCARSLGIQKKYGKTAANTLSRKKWKCRGAKSMR